MPIYAYKCDSCGFAKDVLQKISDPLLTECPVCTAATFSKQVTSAGFQLKGSGWYATDFKGGSAAAASAEPAVADKASDDSASTKTVDAPAAPSKSEAAPAASGGCGTDCACHS
jgi:putative FmdB family regulatory protein